MNLEIDNDNNLVMGTHCGIGTKGCLIISDNEDELISTVGVHDLAIIKRGKELLVIDLVEWMNKKLVPKP